MQIVAATRADAGEDSGEAICEGIWQWLDRRAPDDDEIMSQPQQGSRQRRRIRFVHEANSTLALCFGRDGLKPARALPISF